MKFLDSFPLFKPKEVPVLPRTVHVNEDRAVDSEEDVVFCSNQVITSRYTLLTFLPVNLLEQFKHFVYSYFLLLVVIQFFPQFRLISPGVVILPLIGMLGFRAGKDAYEDWNRHRLDKRVNQSLVEVLRGGSWSNPNPAEPKKESSAVLRFLPNFAKDRVATESDAPAGVDSSAQVKAEKGSSPAPPPETQLEDPESPDTPHWAQIAWEDLRVGDLVKVNENEAIPADLLICATSDEENMAKLTSNPAPPFPPLTHLRTPEECASPKNAFRVKCDKPENNMYRLNAVVEFGSGGQRFPADLQSTLLRGTVLRNTSWVIGVVLFTGNDTKISDQFRADIHHVDVCAIVDSFLEKEYYPLDAPWLLFADESDDNPEINGLITFCYGLLTFQALVPIALYLTLESVHTIQSIFINHDKDMYYEKKKIWTQARNWNLTDDLGQIEYIFSDKTGTLTQNVMVFRQCAIGRKVYKGSAATNREEQTQDTPIIENSRTADPEGQSPTDEDEHRFYDSDLHGDITSAMASTDENSDSHARLLHGFFTVLSLCHTALASTNPETGAIEYKAQSPDEAALVQAAADMGFAFVGKDKEVLSLKKPNGVIEKYELLNILEFDSARKRMSVIVRRMDEQDRDKGVLLLCKGADNVIFERLADGGEELKQATEGHLNEFANEGLRTLTLAFKVIPDDDYEAWAEKYNEAQMAIDDREARIDILSEDIEKDLHLLGATAIEDKLQDGVPETIADLKRAGIKVWVATGDKMETAIAIGRSTNLISSESNIIIIRGGGGKSVQEQLVAAVETFFSEKVSEMKEVLPQTSSIFSQPRLHRVNTGMSSIVGQDNGERPGGYILVVDGAALLQAFDTEENKELLLQLGTACEGVICCRVSPLQKALVVRLVKDGLKAMTLAIGDGANDVSMIQAADVGVGISGEEGLQAVNSSDYAIAQFRFLKKLLLVHGHWSYYRIGTLILAFFYKNTVPSGLSWWYQIYCGWRIWTLCLPYAIGVADRILDDRTMMDLPELYRYGRERTYFSFRTFCSFMIDGVYQSAIIFFFTMLIYDTTSTRPDGYDAAFYERSTTAAVSVVMSTSFFVGMLALSWSWFVLIGSTSPSNERNYLFYGNYYYVFASAPYWLGLLLIISMSLAPRFMFRAYKSAYAPTDIELVRFIQAKERGRDLRALTSQQGDIGLLEMKRPRRASRVSSVGSRRSSMNITGAGAPLARSASRVDMSTGLTSTDRGFDFATEEHGTAIRRLQSNLSQRRRRVRNRVLDSGDGTTGRSKKFWFSSLKRGFKEKRS
ncbi:hypothetical protein VNI00_012141 [Paramarasmius palmivorus]|uniref:Phospholipid-transporting ATPase n=1 Tax=Paramarasmius palmivorus TaxID=297713 RepID=A0AAW0C5I6_9AGAR